MKIFKNKNPWKNYTFYHRMTKTHGDVDRFTACVQIPSKKKLIEMAQELIETNVKTIKLKVGVSIVNPKDSYNKKLGRELSHSRLIPYEFEIHSALATNIVHQYNPEYKESKSDPFTNIELQAETKGKRISVYFTINKLNKVILRNVQLHTWPDYNFLGYKKKLIYDPLDQYLKEEEEDAIG